MKDERSTVTDVVMKHLDYTIYIHNLECLEKKNMQGRKMWYFDLYVFLYVFIVILINQRHIVID